MSSLLVSMLLAWSGIFEVPAGCGTEEDFLEQLRALVGADASRAVPSVLQIDGPTADGRYRLVLQQGNERRELRDSDCPTLLRSAAVISAAAVTPSREPGAKVDDGLQLPTSPGEEPPPTSGSETDGIAPSGSSAEPTDGDPTPRADEPTHDRAAEPGAGERAVDPEDRAGDQTGEPAPSSDRGAGRAARERPARPPWQGELGLSAGIAYGIVPRVGAALEIVGGFARGPWGMQFTVRYIPVTRAEQDGRSVAVMAAGGRAIARREIIPQLHIGVGADVDWLRGEGENVPETATAQLWMLSPSLDLTAVPLPKPRLRLEIGVVGRVAAWRPRFEITGYGEVYQPPRFAVLATVRGLWIFR